jgi:hypothetical protein
LIAGLSIGGVLLLIGIGISIWYALQAPVVSTPNQGANSSTKPSTDKADNKSQNTETSTDKPGLSVGGIVGIVISAFVVVILILCCCCCCRRQRAADPQINSKYSDNQAASRLRRNDSIKSSENVGSNGAIKCKSKMGGSHYIDTQYPVNNSSETESPVFESKTDHLANQLPQYPVFKPIESKVGDKSITHPDQTLTHQQLVSVIDRSMNPVFAQDPSNEPLMAELTEFIEKYPRGDLFDIESEQVPILTENYKSFLGFISRYKRNINAISEEKVFDSDINLTFNLKFASFERGEIFCRKGTPQIEVVRYFFDLNKYVTKILRGLISLRPPNIPTDYAALHNDTEFFRNLNRAIG